MLLFIQTFVKYSKVFTKFSTTSYDYCIIVDVIKTKYLRRADCKWVGEKIFCLNPDNCSYLKEASYEVARFSIMMSSSSSDMPSDGSPKFL